MLHNPYEGTTPSQRLAAAAHRERLFRLSGHAVKLRDAVAPTVDDVQADILEKRWDERQKENWFSVVEEISPKYPSVASIQKEVAKYFEITLLDILSHRRTLKMVYPRQIAMFLSKTRTPRSLPEIGRRFGGKDHTTVLHGVRKIERLIRSDWTVAYDVAHVETML
jgi:chromosomal replication initiation ATPase DnaA